ncbi:Adenosine 5'-monophosphoramidase [Puccinia graminis f. sp. tritici]|uniref:Adenosine 5'-monophosphoramidase n=1 Tax=Puccinia graminis f. sp. tritici TaxID=56615 RepID=A0A5B0P8R8_PUCGR|nr:Adenosine 5'-monophosphoramidase [Puccinia graminis f. sp. tritici]
MTAENECEPNELATQEELIKSKADDECIFCKIIKGAIPCFKIFESSTTLAFFDINPISLGHALVIPKYHGPKLHQLPDFALQDILPIAKKIAMELGLTDYNILQNNGRIAHQEVDHVHFHIIPKLSASDSEGLVIGWPSKKADMQLLDQKAKELKAKLDSQSASSSSNL